MVEKIEVTSYADKCIIIENYLNKQNMPYQKIDGKTFEDVELFRYVIISPDDLAPTIIDSLSKIVDTHQRDIFITNEKVNAIVSGYFDDLIAKIKKPRKVSQIIEELIPQTEPFVKFKKELFIMIIISSMVAMVGLFYDSPAVVIGAMLISPLLGPITAFSFNAAIGRPKKMMQSAISGFVLIASVVGVSAIVTSVALKFVDLSITHEILIRTTTSPIDVIIGILLGIAGGIAMISIIPGILVGVAIAAALVPPATVTGIGLAFLDERIFTGGLLLTSSNIVGLVLGCMIVFFVKKITPRKYYERAQAKKYLIITISIWVILSMLLAAFSVLHEILFASA